MESRECIIPFEASDCASSLLEVNGPNTPITSRQSDSSAEGGSDELNDKFRLVAEESQYLWHELIDEYVSYPPERRQVTLSRLDHLARGWVSYCTKYVEIFSDNTIRAATDCGHHCDSAKLCYEADDFKSSNAGRQVACVVPARPAKEMEVIR